MKTVIPVILAIGFILLGSGFVHAQRLSVKAPIANVRSAPNTQAVVIWQVEQFHPLTVVKKQGNWYLFKDFEGDQGWIHSSLLADIRAVIVNKDKCNVRSGPGTNHEILFTVEKGVPFRVLKEKGKWLHVIHADGDQGWIHRSLVW